LVLQAGKARRIDPGDPKVPRFGRKLYHLKVFGRMSARDQNHLANSEIAIARKMAIRQCAADQAADWEEAYVEFLNRIRRATIRGLVVDYDGTLCDEAKRYGPLEESISAELKRLLRSGIVLGVATGRGKSIRERLREALPKSVWSRVVVGYYNGGDVGLLGDDSTPDGTPEASGSLFATADLLRKYAKYLGIAELECRRKQISLRSTGGQALDGLWRNVEGVLRKAPHPGVTVVRSGHSIDVLAANVSKLVVVDRVTGMINGSKDQVLCIGDQGCWPGNDHELLGTPLSLSVGMTSADPERCWNLVPVGLRESVATLFYLRRLRVSSRGVRFDLSDSRRRSRS